MESISLSFPAKKANFLIDPDIAGDQQHDDYDDGRNKPHNLPRVVYRFLMTAPTNDTSADPNGVIDFNGLLASWADHCRPLFHDIKDMAGPLLSV